MNNILSIFNKETKINIFGIILVSILPAALLSRSAILNTLILIINFFFLFLIYREKKFNFFNNKYFYALLIFWISLLINSIFSANILISLERAFGFIRFIILVFAIKYLLTLENSKYQKIIFLTWLIIFIVTTLDLIFESIFGFNLLGYVSYMPGRLAGFLNKELKIGHFYSAFMLIVVSTYYNLSKKHISTYLIIFLFLIISFLIGERANFLRTLIITTIFIFLFEKGKLNKKIIIITFLVITLGLIINFTDKYKTRFWEQFLRPLTKTSYENYILNSQYGAHYDTANQIFKNNIIFGVGLKNYRNESEKSTYENKKFSETDSRWATHPHQIHWEFLSETGLFGYSIFIFFFVFVIVSNIRSLIIKFNIYQLSSMLFIIASILPLIPSGSFFTTYGATLFWINFAVMISYKKNKN
jgi:hypothetical protein